MQPTQYFFNVNAELSKEHTPRTYIATGVSQVHAEDNLALTNRQLCEVSIANWPASLLRSLPGPLTQSEVQWYDGA